MNLSPVDAAIVLAYFVLILGVGAYMGRRADKDIESYFLGGRTMPWWLLGMSGSSTYFDIAGTMWMVSVFYVLGMRGMWEHCFWCFPFAGFLISFRAKWAYRSGVLTAMEWLILRYGSGRAGQAARLMNVIIFLITTILMLGYAGTGVGKFITVFVPVDKSVSIPLLFAFTGLYVLLGGFFSVVYSDFVQTVLLSFAAIYIGVNAFVSIDPVLFREAVGADWFSLAPVMALPEPAAEYPDLFGLLIMLWVAKGLLLLVGAGANGPEFQRLRAARSEADACRVGFAWGMVISIRWGLVMGFTAFGLYIFAAQGDVVDSEDVLPMVLNQVLPVGVKGLVLAGLLAAFMSTFDSSVNVAASFIVNDMVKPVWKTATERNLMHVSYAATVAVVGLGIVISLYTERIAAIWNPINFALGAALLAPGVLACYWWRISGWAVCASGACTLPAAFYIKLFTDWRELQYFPVLAGISFVSCIAAAYLLPPTPAAALRDFYSKVRPFGAWGPVRKMLADENLDPRRPERDRFDIPVALVGTAFFIVLYVLVMDVVLHNWPRAAILGALTLGSGAFLYAVWWKRLKAD